MEEKIKEIINDIKPYLIDDGGDIDYVGIEDNVVFIKLFGACSICEHQDDTIKDFILRTIQKDYPEITDVINVEL